jgi:hypothetical protein
MHKLRIFAGAVALLLVTPALAQEMGGATGPGSTSGLEPYYHGPYGGYDDGYYQGPPVRTGRAFDSFNAYATTPGDDSCARYRSFDPASGTYIGRDGRRHYCR